MGLKDDFTEANLAQLALLFGEKFIVTRKKVLLLAWVGTEFNAITVDGSVVGPMAGEMGHGVVGRGETCQDMFGVVGVNVFALGP